MSLMRTPAHRIQLHLIMFDEKETVDARERVAISPHLLLWRLSALLPQ